MNEQPPLQIAMQEAVSQILENMVFMEAMAHYDQQYRIPAAELNWAYLVVTDPVPGEIRLALPVALLRKLTGSAFLLAEDEITETAMKDILHELLNTIAGLFMTKLLADNQSYKIGIPGQGEGDLPEAGADTETWKLMTSDEDPLQVQVVGRQLLNYANRSY